MTLDRAAAGRLLDAMQGARVAVVGDVMLDRYVSGDTQRLSPEAPVPVVVVEREFERLGGAANVAANLRALGAVPLLCGVVGDDDTGRDLRGALQAAGIDDSGLVDEPGRVTGCKTRVLCRGQQVVRIDKETTAPIAASTVAALIARLAAVAAGARALIVSDYGKGVLDDGHGASLLGVVPTGVYTCVDPVPHHCSAYPPLLAATPNEREARDALHLAPWDRPDGVALARRFLERFGFAELYLTLGERGIAWAAPGHAPQVMPTRPRQVFDVSGAGDTVIAVLAACRGVGAAPPQAVALANLAAGLVVEKVGTATVTPAEIMGAL